MNAISPAQGSDSAEAVRRALRAGPMSAAQLMGATGLSQPTVSRTIRALAHTVTEFRIPGVRTPQYALLRRLPFDLAARQPVYRVLSSGRIEPFANLEFLAGGLVLERMHKSCRVYTGLPPYMAFAAPSGFLGRQIAQEASRTLPFPSSLRDWGDDHHIAYLFTRGMNLPGNLVFGHDSLQLEMQFRNIQAMPPGEVNAFYLKTVEGLKGATYGSSAGGEQPKFLGMTRELGHVIVKFAKQGTRMAELLPLEQLALASLGTVGVPVAPTNVVLAGDYVFLEVKRFDRVGTMGRVGMLSAGAVDDEFFGMRDTWPEFGARCEQAGYLSSDHARHVDVMAAFSELIGNTDRHFENISLLIDEQGEYAGIAPAYDILPMRYAPLGGGVEPELRPIDPHVGKIGARPEVWDRAVRAAERFWLAVAHEELAAPVSPQMRALAAENLAVAREFAAPLRPAMPEDRA